MKKATGKRSSEASFAKRAILHVSQLFPMKLWEELENACAYFQGKGSIENTLEAEVRAMRHFLTKERGNIVFDVGANKGEWTEEALKQCGSSLAKIFQFEPSQLNCAILNEARDQRTEVVPAAVSDRSGSGDLWADEEGSAGASLYHRDLSYSNQKFDRSSRVDVITLDEFIEKKNIPSVDFLKMDIQGSELRALRGAERAVRRGAIRTIAFEFDASNIDSRVFFKDFWDMLSPLGFNFYRIRPDGNLRRMGTYDWNWESFRTANYIAANQKNSDKSVSDPTPCS